MLVNEYATQLYTILRKKLILGTIRIEVTRESYGNAIIEISYTMKEGYFYIEEFSCYTRIVNIAYTGHAIDTQNTANYWTTLKNKESEWNIAVAEIARTLHFEDNDKIKLV